MPGVKHRIGGYRVIAPIGAGGYATVYRALREETGKEVAIKVLAENHSLLADTRRRFEEEMGLLMTVKSPSIARIYAVGTTETNQPYMVLELADRGDLRRRLEEIRGGHRTLDKEELATLAQHLHDGLRHLHGMEIVHRDVSPGNILIRSEQGRGRRSDSISLLEPGERFLLTDLGHAKDMVLASGFTAGGGTRGFASPEQRDDVTVVDHRADIFAATAILEWAAHDGLFAEALDPFFDIGLAAEPEDRFDSMEEWLGFFDETMTKTEVDGSQRSKVGKVFRRRSSTKSEAAGQAIGGGSDDLALDAVAIDRSLDALVLDSSSAVRPPGGVVPPKMTGLSKVVLPPGSPGDQSIARHRTTTEPGNEHTTSSRGADHREGSASNRGASPPTRVDPEQLVDQAMADEHGQSPGSRRQSRRIALAVVTMVAVGATGYGLTQGYEDLPTILDGAQTVESADQPVRAVPVDSTTAADEAGLEPPEDLMVETGEDTTTGTGDGETEDGEPVDSNDDDGTGSEQAAFGVTISSPMDGEVITGPLVVNGTARAPTGIAQVDISIRQLSTGWYWDGGRQRFGPKWVTMKVRRDETDTVLPWSVTVPEEELSSGDYEVRTWTGRTVGADDVFNDVRTVTVG